MSTEEKSKEKLLDVPDEDDENLLFGTETVKEKKEKDKKYKDEKLNEKLLYG